MRDSIKKKSLGGRGEGARGRGEGDLFKGPLPPSPDFHSTSFPSRNVTRRSESGVIHSWSCETTTTAEPESAA